MTVEDRFKKFHAKNPDVYSYFKQFAWSLISAGHQKLSSKLIVNRIRWETAVTTTGPTYLIDDRYTPWYARLFIDDFPAHGDLFELRVIRTP